jgi:hypothetical protein
MVVDATKGRITQRHAEETIAFDEYSGLSEGALVGVLAFTTTAAVPASSGAKAPALEGRGGELIAEQCRSGERESAPAVPSTAWT